MKARRKQNPFAGESQPTAARAPSSPADQNACDFPAVEEQKACHKLTLKDFVHEAWHILEPVTDLQWNWHLDLICDYLTLIRNKRFKKVCGELEGIIFNVPPRTMKSLLITVFFPIWLWTSDPSRRFMFVSYSEKLSTQHSVFRRSVIESDWYQQRWGRVFSFSRDQNLKSHYENSKRGTMFSTGMQATATGLGGDILIFDDPLNPEQAVSQAEREAVNLRFDATFRSRINDPKTGVKIIIMQRLHELDLTGHVLSRERAPWQHVRLPAVAETDEVLRFPSRRKRRPVKTGDLLWPKRLPKSFLDSQRIGMGSWAFNGQYQQSPAPLDGGIIKRSWVRFYRQLPEKFDFMVQSWDCTFSGGAENDFVAGQVWARCGGKYYMLPFRAYDRLDFGPTMAAIKSCHAKFPEAHAILIEDKANGPAIISELQKEIGGVVAVNPEGGKLARAQAMAPLWEAGSIELPDPQVFHVPWVEDYLHNICAFPKAAHDDDMDSTSQALIWMRTRLGGGIVDFYRRQATGELPRPMAEASRPAAQTALQTAAQRDQHGSADRSVPLSSIPERAGFARAGAEPECPERAGVVRAEVGAPSFANRRSSSADLALARNVIAAVEQGSRIQCNEKQYPVIRAALSRASATRAENAASRLAAQNEIDRLDRIFHCWDVREN